MGIQVFDLANYTLNPYGFAPLITGILTLFLGSFVLIRERGSSVSLAFYFLAWAASVWLVSYLGIYSADSPNIALWWSRTQNMAVSFIPSTIYLFTLAIIGKVRLYRVYLTPIFLASCTFAITARFTDLHIAGVYDYPWGYYTRYGPLIFPFLVFFIGVTIGTFRLLWVAHWRAHLRTQQRRLRSFLIAFGIAYLGSVDYLPAFGIPVFPSGYLAVFVFLILAAWATWRYRLVDLTPSFAAKQILRIMADALLVLDRTGTIRVVNQATCTLFERSEKDLIGKPLWTISGSFLPNERLQRALRSGVIQRYEATYFTKKRSVALDISVSAIPDQENESVGIVCIARAINENSEQKQSRYDASA